MRNCHQGSPRGHKPDVSSQTYHGSKQVSLQKSNHEKIKRMNSEGVSFLTQGSGVGAHQKYPHTPNRWDHIPDNSSSFLLIRPEGETFVLKSEERFRETPRNEKLITQ